MWSIDKMKVGMLGVPVTKGQPKPGVSCAIKLFRKTHLIDEIEKFDIEVHDYGDIELANIEYDPDVLQAKFPRTFNENSIRLSKKVSKMLKHKQMAITIGGDHSLSTGSILGHSSVSGEICVVWVDAHADINTPISSYSKNIHGMPLSFLVKEMQTEMPWIDEFQDLLPVLPGSNLAYIGLRDVDPFERYVIDKHKIKNFPMDEIDRKGINCVVQEAIKAINPNLDKEIHLSFDVDAIDPLYTPSTGTPVSGGMTLREGIYLCEQLFNTGKLRVVDMAEINTQLLSYTDAMTTLNSSRKLILASLGVRREGNARLNPNYYDWKKINPTRNEVYMQKEQENE